MSHSEIAKQTGVHFSLIYAINVGSCWKDENQVYPIVPVRKYRKQVKQDECGKESTAILG